MQQSSQVLGLISGLESPFYSSPCWSVTDVESFLSQQLSVGVFKEDQLVGFILVIDALEALEIVLLGVQKDLQGQGVMKAMLTAWLERQSKKVWLEVSEKNLPALRLYQRVGFISTSVRKEYYSDGTDALLMEKGVC